MKNKVQADGNEVIQHLAPSADEGAKWKDHQIITIHTEGNMNVLIKWPST